jgi:hypothetical protein
MVLKKIPLCVQIHAECGTMKISQSLCSKIRKEHFLDYQVKRHADGFTRCGRCDNLTKQLHLQARDNVIGDSPARTRVCTCILLLESSTKHSPAHASLVYHA